MDTALYQATLERARQDGLQLHPALQRRQVDGVFGMYAHAPIAQGAVLARFPKQRVLPVSTAYAYPPEMADDVRYAHTVIHALREGEASPFWHFFSGLETLTDMQSYSVYFYDEQTLEFTGKASPLLRARIEQFNQFISDAAAALARFDSEIGHDEAVFVLLNMQSRTWGKGGFLPIMDLFNHSDQLGLDRLEDNSSFYFKAKQDYAPGAQVFIRYSIKDMYQHAICYNYFDPSDRHYLNFGSRFVQTARTPFERAVLQHCAAKHPLKVMQDGAVLRYQLINREANFSESGPTEALLAYLRDNCLQSLEELLQQRCQDTSLYGRIGESLRALAEMNRVQALQLEQCPPSFARFFHLLQKERTIIDANQAWLRARS